jgi:hypothetical protein
MVPTSDINASTAPNIKKACHRTKKTVEDLKRCVQEKEIEIRHCYVEISEDIVRDNFAKIILLDSIFIIEYLWKTKQNPPMSSGSKASNSTSSSTSVSAGCSIHV